jgi:hypothetical protein
MVSNYTASHAKRQQCASHAYSTFPRKNAILPSVIFDIPRPIHMVNNSFNIPIAKYEMPIKTDKTASYFPVIK